MAYEIRALTVDDLPASWELTRIAFGAVARRRRAGSATGPDG